MLLAFLESSCQESCSKEKDWVCYSWGGEAENVENVGEQRKQAWGGRSNGRFGVGKVFVMFILSCMHSFTHSSTAGIY